MVLHKFLSKSLRLLAVNKFMTDIFFSPWHYGHKEMKEEGTREEMQRRN